MPQVRVLKERCKSCGLCIEACPKGHLEIGPRFNAQGYAYVRVRRGTECVGCGFCAEMCPDMALRVYREAGRRSKKTG